MANKIRMGMIGAGRIARIHGDNLAYRIPDAELVAISDVVVPAAQQLASQCQVPVVCEDYHAVLDDRSIEAVAICSSTDTHAQIVEEAAAAGKHIFCEKPIALDLKRIDEALAAVERAGVKLQIGFNRRFDPSMKRARDLVAEGKIGTPHLVRVTSRDPKAPPIEYVLRSGGLFMDMTIHDFDMSRYLTGSDVEEVYAVGAVLVDPEIGRAGDIDTAVVTLTFANGAIGTIDNSRQAVYGYDQRVEVFGPKGVVIVANHTPDNAVLANTEGVHGALPLYFFLERYADAFLAEMRAFVEAVQKDETPPVTGIDGRISAIIGYAANKSLAEHRPVRLSEIDPRD